MDAVQSPRVRMRRQEMGARAARRWEITMGGGSLGWRNGDRQAANDPQCGFAPCGAHGISGVLRISWKRRHLRVASCDAALVELDRELR